MTNEQDYLKKRIVYTVPGMENVTVTKNIRYKVSDDGDLHFDIYYPSKANAQQPAPALVFIHGEAAPEELKTAKDWGQYVSWGQLAAASGLIGVTFNHRPSHWFQKLHDVAEDVADLLQYLQVHADELQLDKTRVGIWVCSGGTPPALYTVLQEIPPYLRCIIVCYGRLNLQNLRERLTPRVPDEVLQAFSPITQIAHYEPAHIAPMLIVRCGADTVAGVNQSIDQFVLTALEQNIPFHLINYPQGQHAFDLMDEQEESRHIIKQIIIFASEHLLS